MRVMLIVQLAGGLFLAMDRATEADCTLTLGDVEFAAGESLVSHTAGSGPGRRRRQDHPSGQLLFPHLRDKGRRHRSDFV